MKVTNFAITGLFVAVFLANCANSSENDITVHYNPHSVRMYDATSHSKIYSPSFIAPKTDESLTAKIVKKHATYPTSCCKKSNYEDKSQEWEIDISQNLTSSNSAQTSPMLRIQTKRDLLVQSLDEAAK